MTVKGETFDEDILKQALAGAVHVQADADWGGDEDRQSTSGVIVWAKAETGKWYLAQSAKQTTVVIGKLGLLRKGSVQGHVGQNGFEKTNLRLMIFVLGHSTNSVNAIGI